MPRKSAGNGGRKDNQQATPRKREYKTKPVAVTRTYTLLLRGEERAQAALWATHRAMNEGANIFCDWLLTLGGGLPHQVLTRRERLLTALSWLTVEAGYTGSEELALSPPETLDAFRKILRGRSAPDEEVEEWVSECGHTLLSSIREDAVWVNRSQAFDRLCARIGISDTELAREDALTVWQHLFTESVLVGEADEAEDAQESIKASAAGAGMRTAHLFSHILGDAPEGFGSEEEERGGRRRLHYYKEWGKYLAGAISDATGIRLSTPEERSARYRESGERELSAGPHMREMFFRAAERVAGYRTLLRLQEAERRRLRGADLRLQALEGAEETAPITKRLDEYRELRAIESGALSIYIFTERALVGWEKLVEAWDTCSSEDERREANARLQGDARNKKWGDATLYDVLAADEFIAVWRGPQGGTRPELLRDYASGWRARRDALKLRVTTFRHIEPYQHPIYARFGVSRPTIKIERRQNPGQAPLVTLALWDGVRIRNYTFEARSDRIKEELIPQAAEGGKKEPQPSKRTRLADYALQSAIQERKLTTGGDASEEDVWTALDEVFAETVGGTLLANRERLAKAHEAEGFLRWQLSLSLDLRPQGPWPEFIKRQAGIIEPDYNRGTLSVTARNLRASRWRGLSFPFKRTDQEVGRGGELSRLPGVRVMGCDLRQRYGASCVLWESITLEEFNRQARKARKERKRVEVHPLWAHIEGVGLFRRTGDDSSPAPWARMIFQTLIKLQGERRGDVRAINADEYPILSRLSSLLDREDPMKDGPYLETLRSYTDSTRLFVNRQAALAVLCYQLENGQQPGNWQGRLLQGQGFKAEEVEAEPEAVAKLARTRWDERDKTARKALGLLSQLLQPRKHYLNAPGKGGFSLDRIELLQELYSASKAYEARPTPDRPEGTTIETGFGLDLLRKIARLKRLRSRQLASKITAYALGEDKKGVRRYPHAHAVIIEDLRNYRTDATQNRRTNRNLATWAVATVRDTLAISLQTHGIHLREVEAAYTSKQDAKTALPAMRCVEVTEREFSMSLYWKREAERAQARLESPRESPRDRLLVALKYAIPQSGAISGRSLLIPEEAGFVMVTLEPDGHITKRQVGLNAAANIGLASLLDPTFPAARWRIAARWNPREKAFVAARPEGALKNWKVMPPGSNGNGNGNGRKGGASADKIINLWRDPSTSPLEEGQWLTTRDYWSQYEERVCQALADWRG